MTADDSRLIVRRLLARNGDHYAGTVPIFGYDYHVTLRKVDGGVEIEIRDGVPVVPKKLGTGKYWAEGGATRDGEPE